MIPQHGETGPPLLEIGLGVRPAVAGRAVHRAVDFLEEADHQGAVALQGDGRQRR